VRILNDTGAAEGLLQDVFLRVRRVPERYDSRRDRDSSLETEGGTGTPVPRRYDPNGDRSPHGEPSAKSRLRGVVQALKVLFIDELMSKC
jgi:hypothetical protein